MERYREIEKSIIKKYRKEIWSKFIKAIKDYELIQENDSIMVCISGGKDSFLLAKCIQELVRHGQIPFTAHYVVMDPGYNKLNRQYIEDNAKILNIPIEIFNTDIFEVANKLNPENPCYMCARMRRGHLYNKAKELGCNKIALGHHTFMRRERVGIIFGKPAAAAVFVRRDIGHAHSGCVYKFFRTLFRDNREIPPVKLFTAPGA